MLTTPSTQLELILVIPPLLLDIISPSNPEQFWRMISGIGTIIAIPIVVIQLYAIKKRMDHTRKQITLLQSAETTKLFIEVLDRWSHLYPKRNALLASTPTTTETLLHEYGTDVHKFLASEEWQEEVRPILSFYEFLGVILSDQSFSGDSMKDRVFTLVTVDTFDSDEKGQPLYSLSTAPMYQHLNPYLEYLRTETNYRKNLYAFYDDKLLKYYIEYSKRQDRNAGS